MEITLEVGDNIYCYFYSSDVARYSVTRVTEKTAWCGGIRIPRHVDSEKPFKEIGNTCLYWVETDTLKEKYRRQTTLAQIKRFIMDKADLLTTDQVVRISQIILEAK